MNETAGAAEGFSGRTAWAARLKTPLREFLRTETGGAALLLAATVAALLWANIDVSSYNSVWSTRLSVRLGDSAVAQDLRAWVNTGLMTFFFFVVGLEARREFDMGELRDRRRLVLPLVAGVGGMIVPIAIFLSFNGGRPSAHGWGAAMSTDTAFALGMLTLAASNLPSRMRAYLLTVTVVDDLVALAVITFFYSSHVRMMPVLITVGILAVVLILRFRGERHGIVYAVLGIAAWVAMFKSGVEPIVVGLIMGLLTYASPAARDDLQRASEMFRLFREQPTAELARTASDGLVSAVSPNERLQLLYHPWTSYVIVPLFALANAGLTISGGFLMRALTSPVTLGILVAYIVGKPLGITGSSWLITRLTRRRIQVPVGWAAVVGGGSIAGIGFTVSLLIATLAFHGPQLEEAKLGILGSALIASILTWAIFRVVRMLPKKMKLRALLGTAEPIIDLAAPVDPERDHIRGSEEAPVTVVEYGDFECPYCGQAEPVVRELLADFGDVRYVWRHLPLHDVHPAAQTAAEAAEAAAAQGMFWEMHDLLLDNQNRLRIRELIEHADSLGLDIEQFRADLQRHLGAARVAEDLDSADLSGVTGTPTFFINGKRHYGAYDIETLSAAVRAARARAYLGV